MTLQVYTDAGFKNGVSTHHWRLVNEKNGKQFKIKRRTFLGNEEDINKAELQSISSCLQYLIKNDYTSLTIFTDSEICYSLLSGKSKRTNDDIKYLIFVMKNNNIKIEWTERKTKGIKKADSYCKELQKTVLNRKKYS